MAEQQTHFGLSPAQIAASALATVSASVAASFLGVYGTIVGAGLMSIVSTVGAAVYQHYFRRTGAGLRHLRESTGLVLRAPARPGWWARLVSSMRWKVLGVGVAVVFGVALATVTVIELIAHKPMFALVTGHGGTSGPTVVKAVQGGGGGQPGVPAPRRTDPGQPAVTPSQDPTSTRTPTPPQAPGEASKPAPSQAPPSGGGAPSPPEQQDRPDRPQPQQDGQPQPDGQPPPDGP